MPLSFVVEVLLEVLSYLLERHPNRVGKERRSVTIIPATEIRSIHQKCAVSSSDLNTVGALGGRS